jgi:hypothetical protein
MVPISLPNTASPADAALRYGSLGWPVMPLYELRKLATGWVPV